MKIALSLLLIILICCALDVSRMLLKVISNMDLVNARINSVSKEAEKMRNMVEWWDAMPINKKIDLVKT